MIEKFKPNQDIITDKPGKEDVSRDFYTGIGGKEIAKELDKLHALEVENEVVWVNNNIEFPFNIEKGESNRLGMFLTPKLQKENSKPYHIEAKTGHGRSGILGRIVFKDKEGRLYRDVDLKGIGFSSNLFMGIRTHMRVVPPEVDFDPSYSGGKKTMGILDRPFAENDIKMAEKFLKAGIRTYRPVALIKLGEVVDGDGNKVSVGVAKTWGLIKKGDEPVVEVRAFGTRGRIEDTGNEDGNILMEDAKRLVTQELGINPESFSNKDYLQWFTKTMAVSLARMHDKNWIHGYLTPHNITLDARIVDLDSVETVREINETKKAGKGSHKSFEHDASYALYTITKLKARMGLAVRIEDPYGSDFDVDVLVKYIFWKEYKAERIRLKKKQLKLD